MQELRRGCKKQECGNPEPLVVPELPHESHSARFAESTLRERARVVVLAAEKGLVPPGKPA
jgi:hypothetical protein